MESLYTSYTVQQQQMSPLLKIEYLFCQGDTLIEDLNATQIMNLNSSLQEVGFISQSFMCLVEFIRISVLTNPLKKKNKRLVPMF